MSLRNSKILIVEDEPSQLELLSYNLNAEGYEVFRAETGEDGLLSLEENQADLVILDWMLPQISGLEVCRQIKRNSKTRHIPVIMLTARGEEDDKVRGLDIGADDFVVKPYSIKELLARVRAGLRSTTNGKESGELSLAGIRMDTERHTVSVDDKNVQLGTIEYKLLRVLLQAQGRVLSREQLLERVWKNDLEVETRTVDVNIGRLRKQLKAISDKDYIRTVRGFGYSLGTD